MRGNENDNNSSLSSSFRLTLSPSARSPTKKRLSIFARNNVTGEGGAKEEESLEFSGLVSPRLEKALAKERRSSLVVSSGEQLSSKLLSPVRSMSRVLKRASVKRLIGSPKKDEDDDDDSDSDSEEEDSDSEEEESDSEEEDEEDDDDDDLENNLSKEELVLLLARELQLIDDGEDDDGDQ